MPVRATSPRKPSPRLKTDRELVKGCIQGREEDWNLLIDRYKNLIFSVPIRYGFSRDDAADIFQGVCLELIRQLPKLRDPKALPKWLIQVTANRCYHAKRQGSRMVSRDDEQNTIPEPIDPARAEKIVSDVQEEQILRQALSELSPRCRDLVRMLFYEEPSRPYKEIAAGLGLATGSIGLLRQKCLEHLRERLESAGFL